MQAIDQARQMLLDQLKPIDAEAADLESRLRALKENRSRINGAIKALDATKKPKVKNAANAAKPSPKQQDVRGVAVALVRENPGIVKTDLEELIKHKLTEELGFDLKGFELRWDEVLRSGTFTLQPGDVVSLVGESSDAVLGDRKSSDVA